MLKYFIVAFLGAFYLQNIPTLKSEKKVQQFIIMEIIKFSSETDIKSTYFLYQKELQDNYKHSMRKKSHFP